VEVYTSTCGLEVCVCGGGGEWGDFLTHSSSHRRISWPWYRILISPKFLFHLLSPHRLCFSMFFSAIFFWTEMVEVLVYQIVYSRAVDKFFKTNKKPNWRVDQYFHSPRQKTTGQKYRKDK
jgi:hypothetical protein